MTFLKVDFVNFFWDYHLTGLNFNHPHVVDCLCPCGIKQKVFRRREPRLSNLSEIFKFMCPHIFTVFSHRSLTNNRLHSVHAAHSVWLLEMFTCFKGCHLFLKLLKIQLEALSFLMFCFLMHQSSCLICWNLTCIGHCVLFCHFCHSFPLKDRFLIYFRRTTKMCDW